MRSWSRTLVTVLSVFMLTPVLPAEGAVDSFVDDDTSRFEAYIERAQQVGLVSGCNPPADDRVCPGNLMTRGTMVLMLARGIGLDPPSADPFLTSSGRLGPVSIGALKGAGIATGCRNGAACPDRPLTREEMAALFSRAFRWGEASDTGRFVDISDSPFGEALVNMTDHGGLLACDPPVDERLCPEDVVRRDEAIFALVSVLDLSPVEIERAEPEPPPIGFGDSFDALSLWDGRAPSYRNRVRLTTGGYRESGLAVSIPAGSHYGADFHLHLEDAASSEPDQLYFRYFLKFDADWRTSSSGKLPGFSGVYGSSGKGGYQSSPSNPGWSARLMFSETDDEDPRVRLGYYVYHLGQETRYGDGVRWNEAGRLQPGEWYCLEGQVEMNTPGLADGSLQAWVDGTPALDFSGLEFRRPDEPEIRIESFWFNVYYGGKQVPDRSLGLTIDEVVVDTHRVGCGAGAATTRAAVGDFDGDTYPDSMTWAQCPGGTCLRLETRSIEGTSRIRELRDTAWFSLETHRLGAAAGDVDGDGRDDFIYRGRCDASTPCWRVHRAQGDRVNAENWGDGGRFSRRTGTPTLGDWTGDGLDDIVYQGTCGSEADECWRVHPSTGTGFGPPSDWGHPPAETVSADAVDLNGDGRDDLLYPATCDDGTCWHAQISSGSAFGSPIMAGVVTGAESSGLQFFDLNGDGAADLISWPAGDDGSTIEARFGSKNGLSEPVTLAELSSRVEEVHLDRTVPGAPITAAIRLDCGDDTCIERLYATSHHSLDDADVYRRTMHRRLALPEIV